MMSLTMPVTPDRPLVRSSGWLRSWNATRQTSTRLWATAATMSSTSAGSTDGSTWPMVATMNRNLDRTRS
ncbi:MAG: hypothetical protein IPO80_04870 [Propionibacteriaceae bacterium]|nr:hypothetical protein [Propionibacteriaceae bacterium]